MSTDPARSRLRHPVVVVAGIAFAAVLAVGGWWFFTEGPGWPIVSPRGATVASFNGDGDQVTASFRVREGWRIEWSTEGSAFAMAIRGDANMGTVVDVSEPGEGLTAPPAGGTYFIEVRASGSWTLRVTQGR